MKTRILHTRFWSDPYIQSLTPTERAIFLYLLTNSKVNMCGIYEITAREISFETGYPEEEIIRIVKKFKEDKKIFTYKAWICILNHEKYNSYGKGDRQLPAFVRELTLIPQDFWDSLSTWDTSIHTSIYTRLNTEYIIPNKEREKIGLSDEDLDTIAKEIS